MLVQRSLPTRGAWIEMQRRASNNQSGPCRSPHGERGLKSSGVPSLLTSLCRSPHGERGLKYGDHRAGLCSHFRRSPHGERGLKWRGPGWRIGPAGSLPTRGAWIEIALPIAIGRLNRSLPTRGAWIEMLAVGTKMIISVSRSPHGERGLKSCHCQKGRGTPWVAPHTGSVD